MKIKEGFVLCEVGGNTVAVASGALAGKYHCMIKLNPTGVFLFEYLQKGTSLEEMVQALSEKYEISKETAEKDARIYLESFKKANLLEE